MDKGLTPRALTGLLKALADETRLKMLALLLEQAELCVCHFEQILEITQSKASRHLRYLSNARLVDDRREGVWMHYRLADDMGPERQVILDAVRGALCEAALTDLRQKLAASPGALAASQIACCGPGDRGVTPRDSCPGTACRPRCSHPWPGAQDQSRCCRRLPCARCAWPARR